jgi:hypothetical protein
MAGRLRREPEQEGSRDREVAGGDDAHLLRPRPLVDLLVVGGREAARPDDDGDPPVERGEHVLLDGGGARVVDEDVRRSGVERLCDGRVARRIGTGNAGDELEVGRGADGLGDRAPGPARDAGDADS